MTDTLVDVLLMPNIMALWVPIIIAAALVILMGLVVRHKKVSISKSKKSPDNKKVAFRSLVIVAVLSLVFFFVEPQIIKGLSTPLLTIPFSVVPALLLGLFYTGLQYTPIEIKSDKKKATLTVDFITINLCALFAFLTLFNFSPYFPGAFTSTSNIAIIFIIALVQTFLFSLIVFASEKVKFIRLKNFLGIPNWLICVILFILPWLFLMYEKAIPVVGGLRTL
ncbi:MAG: hypothetical protein KAW41_00955 [Candidatus Diapherotrites archaeon]|nr:hypothetical protein [Candidatus Diapherotrites archaeon]